MAQHRKVPLDYDFLHDLYVVKKYSTAKIAKILGCSRAAVESGLKTVKIPITRQRVPRDRALLHRLYVELGMTAEEIANYFGVDKQTVLNALRDVGIPIRKKGYDPVYKKYADWNDPIVRQIFFGSLLGDGGLYLTGRNNTIVEYIEGHGEDQRDYVRWKAGVMKFTYYETPRSASKIVPEEGISCCISSSCHPFLDECYRRFYTADGKKRADVIVKELDDLGLLIWHLDDGSYNVHPFFLYLNTNKFSHEEQVALCDWFDGRYGIRPTIDRFNNHGGDEELKAIGNWQERLLLCGDRARKYLSVMRPKFELHGLPASLRYKLFEEDNQEYRRKKEGKA
jgi:DNA-binding CsgD family transcriptional regulator